MENVKIYNKQELIKKLAAENFYCDEVALGNYFKELKIEAIFENGEGVEFFDDDALKRILNFLNEKNKMYIEEAAKIQEETTTQSNTNNNQGLEQPQQIQQAQALPQAQTQVPQQTQQIQQVQQEQALAQNNSFKLDISEKTLNMIARVISKKIAKQVNNMLTPDNFKEGNLALFIEENKRLSARVKILEDENEYLRRDLRDLKESYIPSWFGLYKFTGNKKDR